MEGEGTSRFSVSSTRWKNLVSAVAAVVDPTLPAPMASSSEKKDDKVDFVKSEGKDETTTEALEDENEVSREKEESDAQNSTHEQDDTITGNDIDADVHVAPNNELPHSANSDVSLFPRLNTWRKQAVVALEERSLTTRWTTPFSVTGNTATAVKEEETATKFITMNEEANDEVATEESLPSTDVPIVSDETESSIPKDISATAATKLRSWGAMVDSVAIPTQVFRGRYAVATSASVSTTSTTVTPLSPTENQATRIGKLSATAEHWNQLTSQLQPHEYILLLGRGMLGVNLKQCYRLHAGVYTDYLVPNGSAERSGLVHIGDVIVAVGQTDCRKGTIATIPRVIAQASRPVHITMATSGAHPGHPVSYIDIAVAILHGCLKPTADLEPHSVDSLSPPLTTADSGGSMDDASVEEAQMSLVQATSFDIVHPTPVDCCVPNVVFDHDADAFIHPLHPTQSLKDAYASHVAQRNVSSFTEDFVDAACLTHSHLRHAMRQAFVLVVADRRRLAFFQRFLQRQDAAAETASATDWTGLLSLYMELCDFVEFYGLFSRTKRLEYARGLAHKYFLPTVTTAPGNEFQLPELDFHTIVSDSSLRRLETALAATEVPRTVFLDFQSAAFDALTEDPFRAFFISPDCARMRAFLRNTSPYVFISLAAIGDAWKMNTTDAMYANNYLLFCLVHLFCLMEQDEVGENDDVLVATTTEESSGRGLRLAHAASGLCAALWIRRKLLPILRDPPELAMMHLEQLWEIFLAPGVGSLVEGSNPTPAVLCLQQLRSALNDLPGELNPERRAAMLTIVAQKAEALAQELMLDYAINLHTKFRMHKYHEWLCDEISETGTHNSSDLPKLKPGSLKRLLRQTKFPVGITPHQPAHDRVAVTVPGGVSPDVKQPCNADCAIVFGSSLDHEDPVASVDGLPPNICRYVCQSAVTRETSDSHRTAVLLPEEIPATLESYAFSPPSRSKSFPAIQEYWHSADGWEVSLVHFTIPRTDAPETENSSLYGVSLLFHHRMDSMVLSSDDDNLELSVQSEHFSPTNSPLQFVEDGSPRKCIFHLSSALPNFQKQLQERSSWYRRQIQPKDPPSDRNQCLSIGLALVSHQNHILSMRETLSLLLQDFSRSDNRVLPLVNFLGNFAELADGDVESESLQVLLETYLTRASTPWLERPIGAQTEAFLQKAGHELTQCLPPIPLSLMFVTALLEQKIVLTSNRRSVLVSSTMALVELLHPLHWCHLILPRVPSALAADVLQYPAPFILGLPSNDPGIVDLLRDLPDDVTLVDLDIGRVILAPALGHDRDFGRRARSTDSTEVARVLRSQMLHLAQSLGSVLGAHLDPSSWCSDHPLLTLPNGDLSGSPFDKLRRVFGDFTTELLAGTSSCCYWLEEAVVEPEISTTKSSVATIIFDEDQFFHIKQGRHRHSFQSLFGERVAPPSLALSMSEFDLVLELLLRCQSMNAYIGTRERSDMSFSSLE